MAGGPGGREVGRISIKVVPDTSGLREKVKAAAENAERGVEIKLNVELDEKGIRARLKELAKDLTVKIKVQLEGDTEALARLAEIARDREVQFNAVARTAEAAAELARLARDRTVRFNARVNGGGRDGRGIFRAFANGINFLTSTFGRAINGVAQVLSSALSNAFEGASSAFGQFLNKVTNVAGRGVAAFGELASSVLSSGAVATAVAAAIVVAYIVAFAAIINAAIAMVAIIVGALVAVAALIALPAAFAAAGIAIIATNDKIKKSFSDTFKQIKESLTKAATPLIKELAAAMKLLNEALKPGTPLFEALARAFAAASKAVVPFLGAIAQLALQALPGITRAMEGLLKGGFFDALQKAFGDIGRGLGEFFRAIDPANASVALLAIGRLFRTLTPAIGRFADAMASVSPPIIDTITEAFRLLFDGFAQNKDAFAVGAQALGDALVQIVPALVSFMAAFSNASPALIQSFARQIILLMQVLSDPTTLQGLIGMSIVFVELITLLIKLNDVGLKTVQSIAFGIARLIILIQDGWNKITSMTANAWNAVVNFIGNAFNSAAFRVARGIQLIINAVQAGWSNLKTGTSNAWGFISGTIGSKLGQIGSAVASGVKRIASILTSGFSGAISAVIGVFATLVGAVQGAMSALIGAVANAVGHVRSLLGSIGDALGKLPFIDGVDFAMQVGMDPFLSADDVGPVAVELLASGQLAPSLASFDPMIRTAMRSIGTNPTKNPPAAKSYSVIVNGVDPLPPEQTITRALRYADTLYDDNL